MNINTFALRNRVCYLESGAGFKMPVHVRDITMTTDGTTYVVEGTNMGTPMVNFKNSVMIKNVIFNDPATIVFWSDGTKTVVKAENEPFDPEKGLAMAIAKKHFGNKGNYFNEIKKWTEKCDKRFGEQLIDALYDAIEHRDAMEDAFSILCDIDRKQKATKHELITAIQEAIGYLSVVR